VSALPPGRRLFEGALRVLYAGGWPARLWGSVPVASRVRLVERTMPILPPGVPDLRVAFLSDLHLGPTTPRGLLDAAFRAVSESRPDLLLLGGDYVFLEFTEAKARELAARVADVPARAKVAVLGNHDRWTDWRLVAWALESGGARVLVNEAARMPAPYHDVCVLGLDDPMTGHPDAGAALEGAGDARVRIALCHAVEGTLGLANAGIDLFLCGHTHGGQVASPWGPLHVPGPLGQHHHAGFGEREGFPLFVSRGVGGVSVPMRTWAPPDVAVLDLVGAEARA
jgi:predicted MPP superfamily phosphohydrolase